VAEALAKRPDTAARSVLPKADRERVDYEALAIKAFRKVGYGQTVSRIDVKSHRFWLEEDPRVKPGERAIGVKQSRLFHRSQVEVMTEAEKKAAQAKLAAKTADKLPKVSPITEQAPQAKASKAAKTRKVIPISGEVTSGD
jgi:hypothetical protein